MQLKVYYYFLKHGLKILIENRINLIANLIVVFLNQFVALFFIFIISKNVTALNGWNGYELTFIYSIYLISRSIEGFFTNNLYFIEGIVRFGELDKYLTKPIGVLKQILFQQVDFQQIFILITSIILLIYINSILKINFDFFNILILILFIIFNVLIFFSLKLIFISFVFWTQTSFSIAYGICDVAEFSKYPITIYPNFLQFILKFILPFVYIAYYPAAILLNKESYLLIILFGFIICFILLSISLIVWKKGLKKYSSSGN